MENNIIYAVEEVIGLGVQESPLEGRILVDEVFTDKIIASRRAEELWLKNTTKKERNSGWCGLHYKVKKITLNGK